MKTIITALVITIFCINVQSQEFQTHSNGLIYDNDTMEQLKFIVDSLNLKFKACEITETYYAKPQAMALVFNLESGDIKQATKDLENNMSPELLKKAYPSATITTPKLIITYDYADYNDNITTQILTKTISENANKVIELDSKVNVLEAFKQGDWIIDYYKGSDYRNEHVTAFYLLEDFNRKKLKDTYAEMVQYSDCMIDTTSAKIFDDAGYGFVELPKNYRKQSKRRQEKLLDKMRNMKVMGMCSQDSRPREHAINIAKLSAETVNWEVFLKAHLDVMNDRFERVSDGNYAWAARKTYLKELEELDINTVNLLLGITLQIDNANKNHYYGSIRRLGRALSESQNQVQFEKTILRMIKDDDLDDYNRYILYYLYDNYLYNLNDCEDDTEREEKFRHVEAQLKLVQKFLPSYLVASN